LNIGFVIMGATQFSPEYNKLAQGVLVWKLIVRWKHGRSVDSRYLKRQLRKNCIDIAVVRDMSFADAQVQLRTAYRRSNQFSKAAGDTRSSWLESLAVAWSASSGLSSEQELKSMLNRELQRREARIIKSTLSDSFSAGLSMIQYQSETGLVEVYKQVEMEQCLCEQLAQRFHQAAHTPFSTGPLLRLLGPLGTGAGAEAILEGTFQCPDTVDMWTQKLLPHLQYATNAFKVQEEFEMLLSLEEHARG
jgi:hypothetical protein